MYKIEDIKSIIVKNNQQVVTLRDGESFEILDAVRSANFGDSVKEYLIVCFEMDTEIVDTQKVNFNYWNILVIWLDRSGQLVESYYPINKMNSSLNLDDNTLTDKAILSFNKICSGLKFKKDLSLFGGYYYIPQGNSYELR